MSELYAWAQVMPNLDRYPRWLVQSQTPFICLGVLALILLAVVLALAAWRLFAPAWKAMLEASSPAK